MNKTTNTSFFAFLIMFLSVFYSCTQEPPVAPSPSPHGTTNISYQISVNNNIENGRIIADKTSAEEGSLVTITVTANTGFELNTITILKGSQTIPVTTIINGYKYSFSMPDGSVFVTAIFKESITSGQEQTILVTFSSMGGSEVSSQVINKGSNATKPANPTKNNCEFDGWYTSTDGGLTLSDNPFDFTTAITDSIILYAKWKTSSSSGQSGIILNKTTLNLTKLESTTLSATVSQNQNNSSDITIYWKSSDNSIASVNSNGLVIAEDKGTAVITAYYYDYANNAEEVSADCSVTVTYATKNTDDFVLVEGSSINLTADLTPKSAVFIPKRPIEIKDIYVCKHEVTQAEFEKYCTYIDDGPTETDGKGDNYPVYGLSWIEAMMYCNLRSIAENLTPCYTFYHSSQGYVSEGLKDPRKWLEIDTKVINGSIKYHGPLADSTTFNLWIDESTGIQFDQTANGYRLPTEAEWEYTARNRNRDNFIHSGSDNLDEVAWYNDYNASVSAEIHIEETTYGEVMQKQPNGLGIFDMTGNVAEICFDYYINPINTSSPSIITTPDASGTRVVRGNSMQISVNHRERSWFSTGLRVVRNAE